MIVTIGHGVAAMKQSLNHVSTSSHGIMIVAVGHGVAAMEQSLNQ